jgi:hypothetical protein
MPRRKKYKGKDYMGAFKLILIILFPWFFLSYIIIFMAISLIRNKEPNEMKHPILHNTFYLIKMGKEKLWRMLKWKS